MRDRENDLAILRKILENNKISLRKVVSPTSDAKTVLKEKQIKNFVPLHDNPQKRTWLYRAYKRNGCLVMIATIVTSLFLSILTSIYIFHFGQGMTMLVTVLSMFIVAFVVNHYTAGVDESEMQKCKRKLRVKNKNQDDEEWPRLANGVICPDCKNFMILENEDGSFVCQDCGCIF